MWAPPVVVEQPLVQVLLQAAARRVEQTTQSALEARLPHHLRRALGNAVRLDGARASAVAVLYNEVVRSYNKHERSGSTLLTDRGVLLSGPAALGRTCRGLPVRDLRIFPDQGGAYGGEVYLHDTKTQKRSRTVPLTDGLCRALLILAQSKQPDEPVFSIRYMDLDYRWKQARKEARLEHVPFKDLRAQVSIYGEEAGVPLTVLSRHMGHSQEAMTQRYQQRATLLSVSHLEAIESAMLRPPKKGRGAV